MENQKSDWLIMIAKKKHRKFITDNLVEIYCKERKRKLSWIRSDLGDYDMWKFYKKPKEITAISHILSGNNLTGIILIDRYGEY